MPVADRPQGARAAHRARADLVAGAAGLGWDICPTDGVTFPEHLVPKLVRPGACGLRVTGPDFEATAWRARRTSGGIPGLSGVRLTLLTVPAPDADLEIFFGRMPDGRSAIVMPDAFRDRVALLPEARVMAGGDIEKVLAELEHLLGRIAGPHLNLVVWHGLVHLVSTIEPDTGALAERVALAHEIRDALAAGRTEPAARTGQTEPAAQLEPAEQTEAVDPAGSADQG